ncbi:MAG: alpha/beta hydrolase [Bacillota bacterium]|jgi:alpha-beta hydrolase superfamily lysophospholipase|nr:alpha/beta hydrolase [Bacillota bacterium]
MDAETLYLTMDDGASIFVRTWQTAQPPRGVLQIAHGMAEHSGRYAHFAKFCTDRGFIVAANDHRGHGRTGEKSGLMGYLAEKDGFERLVDDLYAVQAWARERYPGLPIFLMGHSMGSFLARRYLQKYGETVSGAILMGSGGHPGFALKLGKLIARLQMSRNAKKPSLLLDKIAFGAYNRGIKPVKTKFDWLSRDDGEVRKYIADPYCGIVCSAGFFFDLFTGLEAIHDPALIHQIPKDMPILAVSGDADPVGGHGRGVAEFVGQLKKYGVANVEMKLYPEARHELLNELNKEEVMADLLAWLEARLEEQPG